MTELERRPDEITKKEAIEKIQMIWGATATTRAAIQAMPDHANSIREGFLETVVQILNTK